MGRSNARAAGLRRISPPLFALALGLGACQSVEDVKQAEGQGATQTYVATYESIWEAMPVMVERTGLEVAAKEPGTILASHAPSAFSFGERVAVFVRPRGDQLTEVEVVSRPAMSTNVLANDWSDEIFEQVGGRFRGYVAAPGRDHQSRPGPHRLTPEDFLAK